MCGQHTTAVLDCVAEPGLNETRKERSKILVVIGHHSHLIMADDWICVIELDVGKRGHLEDLHRLSNLAGQDSFKNR